MDNYIPTSDDRLNLINKLKKSNPGQDLEMLLSKKFKERKQSYESIKKDVDDFDYQITQKG